MLKYHIQTSGRSLHAREIQFNDIRTTLQALYALFDNCNSLHTNAYDEALTTPTEESVRRAVAIQLIINRELGLNATQNPWQGSFMIDYLTDMVEEAVYQEFESISERGGVLGAMETMYQRGKIQEESLYYETRKHDGSLPIIGVNTFLSKHDAAAEHAAVALIRSTEEEKQQQVTGVKSFQARGAAQRAAALERLRPTAAGNGNTFGDLMVAARCASLGQISRALYEVGRPVPPQHVRRATRRVSATRVGLVESAEDRGPRALAQVDRVRHRALRHLERRQHLHLDDSRAAESKRSGGRRSRVPRITQGTTVSEERAAIVKAPE